MRTNRMLMAVVVVMMVGIVVGQNVPLMINFQGVIRQQGVLYSGDGEFRLAIIDNGTPPLILWSNDGSKLGWDADANMPDNPVTLKVENGRYSVKLGDTSLTNMTAIPTSVFEGRSTVYLRVWFNKPGETSQRLAPDAQLVSVPYAYVAGSVDGSALTDGSITRGKLARESVVPENAGRSNSVKSIYFDETTGAINKTLYTVPAGKTFVLTDMFISFSDTGPIWEFRRNTSIDDQYLVLKVDARLVGGLSNFGLTFRGGIPFYENEVIAVRQAWTGDSRQIVGVITGYEF